MTVTSQNYLPLLYGWNISNTALNTNQSIKDFSNLWLRVSVLRLELFNVLKLKVQFVGESDPVLGVGFKGHILECCVINNRPSNIRGECHPAKLFYKKEKGINGPYVHYANIGQYKDQVVFAIHQWKSYQCEYSQRPVLNEYT